MTEETKMILEELKKLNDKVTDIQLTLEDLEKYSAENGYKKA